MPVVASERLPGTTADKGHAHWPRCAYGLIAGAASGSHGSSNHV